MREILFKAKRVDNGEWVEGYYLCDNLKNNDMQNDYEIHSMLAIEKETQTNTIKTMFYEIDPNTLSQYTRLKDKHGNKIFENDIVTMSNENYVIVWETTGNDPEYKIQGFGCNHIKGYMGNIPLRTKQNERLEIIGNKFDNPELLEKGGAS